MEYDILTLTTDEIDDLTVIQTKLLRTAQKSKNELTHKMEQTLEVFARLLIANGMKDSSLYDDKKAELTKEYNYQVEIIREHLIFNMSLNEPTTEDDMGGSSTGGGTGTDNYIVDYSLSYLDRYIIVREYYMAIEDPDERVALYAADDVAKEYLGTYYRTLYTYLQEYT